MTVRSCSTTWPASVTILYSSVRKNYSGSFSVYGSLFVKGEYAQPYGRALRALFPPEILEQTVDHTGRLSSREKSRSTVVSSGCTQSSCLGSPNPYLRLHTGTADLLR
jgi:hypothetical protein